VPGDSEELDESEVTVFTVVKDFCVRFHNHVTTASGKVSCEKMRKLEFYDPQKE
jgi:hypothetical protein